MFQMEISMFPLILVTNSKMEKKWLQFFENHDGDSRNLELFLLRFSDVADESK